MNLAFFDLDKTLYDGYSNRPLVEYLLGQNPNSHLAELYDQRKKDYENGKLNYNQATRLALELTGALAKGYRQSELEQVVAKIFALPQPFYPWVDKVLDFLRKHEFRLYIVSGSPDLVVANLAALIGIDHWFATQFLLSPNGTYSGEVVLMNHSSKYHVLEKIIGELAENHHVVVFGDSPGDVPMLEAADLGFVVSPDHQSEMQNDIDKNRWIVLEHKTAEAQVKKAVKNLLKIKD